MDRIAAGNIELISIKEPSRIEEQMPLMRLRIRPSHESD
jgi:hypothetical protein